MVEVFGARPPLFFIIPPVSPKYLPGMVILFIEMQVMMVTLHAFHALGIISLSNFLFLYR